MKLTLKDLVTGRTVDIADGASPSWWASGNGSCDCNRAPHFQGLDEEMEAAARAAQPEAYAALGPSAGLCYGCQRVVVIATDQSDYALEDLNACYPAGSWLPDYRPQTPAR